MDNKKERLNIGFFTCHLDNDYAYEVCKGVDYAAKEADVNLIIFPGMYMNASYDDSRNARFDYQYNSIFYYASKNTLDALIVSIGAIASFLSVSDIEAFLKNFNIPIITIEIEVPGYPCVHTEGKTGIKQAIEHLIKYHGKKNIGFVSGRRENADAKERLDTYIETLQENNIPIDKRKIVYGDFSEFTEAIVDDLLDDNPDLEAIVFANDQMAIGGYNTIKKRGLEIGKDILVVGYDDSPVSLVLDPKLSTVHNQIMDMGYNAVYEAINLINTGHTNKSVLNSYFLIRSSCGCGKCNFDNLITTIDNKYKTEGFDNAIRCIEDYVFCGHETSFYYDEILETAKPFLLSLLEPILVNKDYDFNKEKIYEELQKALYTKSVSNFFNINRLSNSISNLHDLLLAIAKNDQEATKVLSIFNYILDGIVLYSSGNTFRRLHQYQSRIWTSMYITRDTLTYSDDEEACFKLMLDTLCDSHFVSSYIYIYEDPIMLLPSGAWKIPRSLYLQAYNKNGETHYLTGPNRIIESTEVFHNRYSKDSRRKTLVVTPLFTNSIQHGLFVGEIDIEFFSNIYSAALQVSTSLNFIALMKQQLAIQKKLAISAAELNEKNNLLNMLSVTDVLTGINNRRGFLDKMHEIITNSSNEGKRAMIVFCDMDNLKQVNDFYGHNNGDFAIKSIANILKECFCEPTDIIGRIGGDEFVAFTYMSDVQKQSDVKRNISDLSTQLNDTCGKEYYIDTSVGIATFICSRTVNIEDILHNADEALYESKKHKRKNVTKTDI